MLHLPPTDNKKILRLTSDTRSMSHAKHYFTQSDAFFGLFSRRLQFQQQQRYPRASAVKYLAENIIFSTDSTAYDYCASAAVDTQTQIMGRNVIFEANGDGPITSDNVQEALEEITMELVDVMEGTWDIANRNQESLHSSTGKIIIYDDGTFDLIKGSFAAIGIGAEPPDSMMVCNRAEDSQTYPLFTKGLIAFSFQMHSSPTLSSLIPQAVKIRENEIVFLGDGGCGEMSRKRISVLKRVIK